MPKLNSGSHYYFNPKDTLLVDVVYIEREITDQLVIIYWENGTRQIDTKENLGKKYNIYQK